MLRILEAHELAAVSGGGIKPAFAIRPANRTTIDRGIRPNPNTTRR